MTSKKSVGRPRRNSDSQQPDTPKRILAIAEALLEQKGFAGTSMEDVSAAAGLTKGTLYHYFASKDGLVTQTLHGVLDRESSVTKTALERASSAIEQLRVMAQLSFSRQQHTQRIMNMVADAQRFLPEPMWQELFARFMAEAHAPLEGIMRFGINNGEFEPHDTAFSTWAFMGLLSQLADPQLQFSQPDTVDHLLEFVLRGIAKR